MSCRSNEAGLLPEPGLEELGQAKAKFGQGPSSPNSARGQAPPGWPRAELPSSAHFDHFLLGCFMIVYLLQALNKVTLAPFSSFRRPFLARQEPRQPCARGTL